MRRLLLATCFCIISLQLAAQHFEVVGLENSYKGTVGEVILAPLKIRNTSDKPLTLIIKKAENLIGSSQKNFFCPDNNCLDQHTETFTLKIGPGETVHNFSVGLEAGLTEGFSSVNYVLYNKLTPAEITHIELNFHVEAKAKTGSIYSSPSITLRDLYPNPVTTTAQIDYNIHHENLKAKIIIHNILGSAISVYELLPHVKTIKLDAASLNPGIYFYTLYVNNQGVMTRKLMVKK